MFQGMEYVYEVYKEKSFSKAAANLYISQPSLSANVKRVEKRIGYPIFDRSTKPLSLTPCGRQYIQSVEKILAIQNEFANFVNDLGELKTGSLVLGGSNLFSSFILPSLIAEFAQLHPQITINLIEESTSHLTEMLQQGTVDLILENTALDSTIFDKKIYREDHLLLAVPKDFSINQKLADYQLSDKQILHHTFLEDGTPSVPLHLFKDETFILMKPNNDTGIRARELFQISQFEPNTVLEMDQQMTSYNITCSGMGISFIGDVVLEKMPPNANVIYYKLPSETSSRNVCFYWKKGRYVSRTMQEFLKLAVG